MLITVLALIAALQSQTPAPAVQAAPAEAVPAPAPATPEPAAAPEPEGEPTADAPRTREVCRYVEVPGRRFPARRCRTIEVED